MGEPLKREDSHIRVFNFVKLSMVIQVLKGYAAVVAVITLQNVK